MHKYSWLSKKMHEILPPLYALSMMQGVHLVNKGGIKLAKIETNKHPTKSTKKLHSSRKKRNKSCFCFHTSLIQSFNIKFKVTSLKKGSITFFFRLWEFIFSSHESKRCWTVHRDERINYYSVGICAKQSGTIKNVEHSKNDSHERSKQVPKDWHSGDFEAKWQEKELRK